MSWPRETPNDYLNFAINLGDADDPPGTEGGATSTVEASYGGFNLASNLFGNANNGVPLTVRAGGRRREPWLCGRRIQYYSQPE